MKKHFTLMLDLEGTIIGTDKIKQFKNPANLRPYAQYFLEEIETLFDDFYLNTVISNKRTKISYGAQEIMKTFFGKTNYKYYDWSRRDGKIANYNSFQDTTIIHIEDGIGKLGQKEIDETHHIYLPIMHWGLPQIYGKDNELIKKEVFGLIYVLENIKAIIKK